MASREDEALEEVKFKDPSSMNASANSVASESCFVVFSWQNCGRGNAQTWSQCYTAVYWSTDRAGLGTNRYI